jgi:hypothetical protein
MDPALNISMAFVYFDSEELKALQAVYQHEARVDWAAYDRARLRIINPLVTPPINEHPPKDEEDPLTN